MISGLSFRQILRNSFGYKVGLNYSLSRSSYDIKNVFTNIYNFHFVGIEGGGTYSFGAFPFIQKRYPKRLEFFIYTGLSLNYLMDMNIDEKIFNQEEYDKNISIINSDKENNILLSTKNSNVVKFSINLLISIEGKYKIKKGHFISAFCKYSQGLNELNKNNKNSIKISNVFVGFGYTISYETLFGRSYGR